MYSMEYLVQKNNKKYAFYGRAISGEPMLVQLLNMMSIREEIRRDEYDMAADVHQIRESADEGVDIHQILTVARIFEKPIEQIIMANGKLLVPRAGVSSKKDGSQYYEIDIPKPESRFCIGRPTNIGQLLFEGEISASSSSINDAVGGYYRCHKFGNSTISDGYGNNIRGRVHGSPPEHRIDIQGGGGNMINYPDDKIKQQGLMGLVAEQAVAGVLTNRIAASSSSGTSSLGVHYMEVAIVLGLSFKLAATALKPKRRRHRLSIWMAKIGNMLTASAIIVSLAMHLPPLIASTAAPLAFLIIALALLFA